MLKLKLFLLCCLVSPILCIATGNFQTKEDMIRDLEIIQSAFDVKYGPKEWKASYSGWDLQEAIDLAKEKVLSQEYPSVRDYQKIVKSFFNSMQDYHVRVSFSNTEKAYLPFAVRGVDDRYFVTAVEDDFTLLKVGDEIISIDGRAVSDIIEEILDSDFGPERKLTDRTLAESMLTLKLAAVGNVVPQGIVVFTVKEKVSGLVKDCKLKWSYQPEMIKGLSNNGNLTLNDGEICFDKNLLKHPIFHKKFKAPFSDVLSQAKKQIDVHNGKFFGDKKPWVHEKLGYHYSKIPRLGKVRWELQESDYFDAYIFETPKNELVGFIRIPSFDPDDPEEASEEFGAIMNFFEAHTRCVVIDQLDNPGGDMLYMYSLLSTLSKIPLKLFSDRETITQQDVMLGIQYNEFFDFLIENTDLFDVNDIMGDTWSGYPIDIDLIKGFRKYFRFLVHEWNAGRHFSNSNYIYGIETIKPSKKYKYSKPILLLINELDFSCGDMFPSVLQDNKRALLMGAGTAGAGGYVISNQYYNWYGISQYSITGSIAERINGQKIENLGVQPDVIYNTTVNDLQNNNADYVVEINKVISTKLLKK